MFVHYLQLGIFFSHVLLLGRYLGSSLGYRFILVFVFVFDIGPFFFFFLGCRVLGLGSFLGYRYRTLYSAIPYIAVPLSPSNTQHRGRQVPT